MILSDAEIQARLDDGSIVIEPLLDPDLQIQPASVDLRLARTFVVYNLAHVPCIDPRDPETVQKYTRTMEVEDGDAFILHPGEFVLGSTAEWVEIPDDLVARVEGRSSIGRIAVVVHASLPAQEEVFLWTPEEGFGLYPIGQVVEQRRQARVVGFDPQTLEVSTHAITDYITNPPKELFRLTLADGRRVHITRDHNLFTLDEAGEVTRVPGEDAEGHWVMLPAQLPGPAEPEARLDLGELLRGQDGVDFDRATVSVRGSMIPRQLPVDAELGWALGLHLARGTRRGDALHIQDAPRGALERAARWLGGRDARIDWGDHGGLVAHTPALARAFEALTQGPGLPARAWGFGDEVLEAMLGGVVAGLGGQDGPRAWLEGAGEALASHLGYLGARLGRRTALERRAGERWRLELEPGGAPGRQVPTPGRLLVELRDRAGLTRAEAAAGAGLEGPEALADLEGARAPSVSHERLASLRDLYAEAGAEVSRLDVILDAGVRFARVVEAAPTGRVEVTYDLEVRPEARVIENFVGGSGGMFLSNTAGFIDPGFQGRITLELSNLGRVAVKLYPGMRISQLVFHTMAQPAARPYGPARGSKYFGQRGPEISRITQDPDADGERGEDT